MNDLARTALIVFRTHLARMLRARRMLGCLLLALLPVAPVALVSHLRRQIDPGDVLADVSWFLVLQIVVPLVALIAGSAAVAEEVADRTITYVLVRPVSRTGFLLGRWLATLVPVALVVFLAVAAVFAAARDPASSVHGVPSPLFRHVLGVTLLGGMVYATVFTAAGAWLRHPVIAGLAYTFAFEGLLANLPGATMEISLQHHLRCLLVGLGDPRWREHGDQLLIQVEPGGEALGTLLATLVLSLAAGILLFRRRQFP